MVGAEAEVPPTFLASPESSTKYFDPSERREHKRSWVVFSQKAFEMTAILFFCVAQRLKESRGQDEDLEDSRAEMSGNILPPFWK